MLTVLGYILLLLTLYFYFLLLAFKIYLYEEKLKIWFVVICHNEEKIPKWYGNSLLSGLSCKKAEQNNNKTPGRMTGPISESLNERIFWKKGCFIFFQVYM